MPAHLERKLEERREARLRTAKSLPLVSENYVALALRSPRKAPRGKGKKNLLSAFNAADEWVVVALESEDDDSNKENADRAPVDHVERQERAARKRDLILRERVARAREMASPAKSAAKSTTTRAAERSRIESKLDVAALRKTSLICDRVCRAKELARLRTPRKRSRGSTPFAMARSAATRNPANLQRAIEAKQRAADKRRRTALATRVKRASELSTASALSLLKLRERKQFKADELQARLLAAEERRADHLATRKRKAARMAAPAVTAEEMVAKTHLISEVLSFKMEEAAARRRALLAARVRRAGELGEGSVLIWIRRRNQFLRDVLSARLEAANERRAELLQSRRRVAQAMSGDAVANFMRTEERQMRKALANLWHLKLEAAGARRNIQLIQRQRRAYELGDEIARANMEVRQTHMALALAARMQGAERRRRAHLCARAAKARLLGGEQDAKARRKRLLSQKASRIMKKLQAAEAKRKMHLVTKSKRATELGTDRVEKTHVALMMSTAIQDCARVGRIKAAEFRRNQALFDWQTRAARNNARAATIANFVGERNQFEREIGERYIAFKMARAEMNRDVARLLRCGLSGNPTFTLVKPIAFMA